MKNGVFESIFVEDEGLDLTEYKAIKEKLHTIFAGTRTAGIDPIRAFVPLVLIAQLECAGAPDDVRAQLEAASVLGCTGQDRGTRWKLCWLVGHYLGPVLRPYVKHTKESVACARDELERLEALQRSEEGIYRG